MNETRKQIIEIIEPYMDKTLSQGCYIKPLYFKEEQEIAMVLWINVTYDRHWDEYKFLKIDRKIQWEDQIVFDDREIIGHYDITTVLKYIQQKSDESKWKTPWYWEWYEAIYLREDMLSWKTAVNGLLIPNKPLHLFSDTEEKDLLELLHKIWTK